MADAICKLTVIPRERASVSNFKGDPIVCELAPMTTTACTVAYDVPSKTECRLNALRASCRYVPPSSLQASSVKSPAAPHAKTARSSVSWCPKISVLPRGAASATDARIPPLLRLKNIDVNSSIICSRVRQGGRSLRCVGGIPLRVPWRGRMRVVWTL